MREFGNDLAAQAKGALIFETKSALKRLVEDHARVLIRERELLEMTISLVSSKIQKSLYYNHNDFLFETAPYFSAKASPSDKEHEKDMYCFFKPHGQCTPLKVNLMNLRIYSHTLHGEKNEFQDISNKLVSMLPFFRTLKTKHPELILWQHIILENGITMVYPDPGISYSRRLYHDNILPDWYQTTKVKKKINWSQPTLDPITRNIVFFLSAPFYDTTGNFMGASAIAVPLTVFLHENDHIRLLSDQVTSLLIRAEISDEIKIRIIAQESSHAARHMHWLAAASPKWLDSLEKTQLLEMSDNLKNYRAVVREIFYEGRPSLIAYQSFDEHGTGLLLIIPKDDVLRDANQMEQYVHDRIDDQIVFTGIILSSIIIVVILLSFVLSRSVTKNISKLADAASRVASGDFQARVRLKSRDELGELGERFNEMIPALQERVYMKQSLNFAMEVQQSLFPSKIPYVEGIDIAAKSIYCHETGGDFYDFMDVIRENKINTAIAVGDVTGHGLSAALLMATSRAFLRSRLTQPGTMGQIMIDINRLLVKDTSETCQFVTLFYLEINHEEKMFQWIRAGHDPGILYDPSNDNFLDLESPGPALGIIGDYEFQETSGMEYESGQILLIGTDGIWETRDASGQMFKKDRVKQIIREHRHESAKQIMEAITSSLSNFRGNQLQHDDVTLVVIKAE